MTEAPQNHQPSSLDNLQAAMLLHKSREAGTKIRSLPEFMKPHNLKEAYFLQNEFARTQDGHQVGWKIAATSIAGQKHVNVDRPMIGRIYSGCVFGNGAEISLNRNAMRLAEIEFVFTLAADLPPRPQDYEPEEIMLAVGDLRLGIEFPDSRFSDPAEAGQLQMIADNALALTFILGPIVDKFWRQIDLSTCEVTGIVKGSNGQRESMGIGANVLGNPMTALIWMVNELSRLNIGVSAGEFVTTGTCCTPFAVNIGEELTADYGPLGMVTCSFVD